MQMHSFTGCLKKMHTDILLLSYYFLLVAANSETCEHSVANIFGEGSYLAGPIYANAASGYCVSRSSILKVNFSYNRTTTRTGLNKLLKQISIRNANGSDRFLTFAASESPLTVEQQQQFPELLMIPVVAIPVAIVFNLPKISSISLTTQSIADIYMGNIKMWNDPVLVKLNPNIFLPNKTILPVARMDIESSVTFVFTSALSAISPEWNLTYGTFNDAQFPNDECCESRNWPKNVIAYYGNTANGLIGIVSSIPYTIGYSTVYEAILAQTPYASVYNHAGRLTEPSDYSTQAAVKYFSPENNKNGENLTDFFLDVNNGHSHDAYPFVTLSYIVINRTTSPYISCCAMQELLGFILYVYSHETDDLNEQYNMVALADSFEDYIIKHLFPLITCQGNAVYSQYLTSLIKPDAFEIWKNLIIIFSVVFSFLFCVLIVGYFIYSRRQKRIRDLAWLVKSDEFNQLVEVPVIMEFMDENGPTINSSRSLARSLQGSVQEKTMMKGNEEKFKAFWKRNGNHVVLTKLQNFFNVKWSQKAKLTLIRFVKEFQHDNIAYFYGITEISSAPYLIRQFFTKGTLHRCLSHSEYEITIEMKCCIAKNVIEGLTYLHKKHTPHGFLNSLSCFVDANWTVKIGDWQCLTVVNLLNPSCVLDTINQKRKTLDNDNILIELLYLDPKLPTYNRVQLYQSDIFSYGNLLIEIFTLKLPYLNQVEEGIYTYQSLFDAKFDTKTALLPPTCDDEVPINVRTLISHCLSDNLERPDVGWVQSQVKHLFNVQSNKGMIDIVMSSMEKCIEDRTSELREMTKRLEGILYEVLPPQIAGKLLSGQTVVPEYFDSCTIFFSDIVGFTTISARSSPTEVMSFLNETWTIFDKILEQFDVYKVDTIGDAYMVASGVPNRNGMLHCKNIANFALSLSLNTKSFTIKHLQNEYLKIRMGVNSGPVTAGIVGRKMPQYCIFGDTVNTSSRMESTSLPGKIQLSPNTKDLLSRYFPEFQTEVRGNVEVKGKGSMTTFWLLDKNIDNSSNGN